MAKRQTKKKPVSTRLRYQFLIPDGYGRRANMEFDSMNARRIGIQHIKHISQQLKDKGPIQPITLEWLSELDDEQHLKLSDAGLVSPRHKPQSEDRSLKQLVDRFMPTAATLKPTTQKKLQQVCDALLRYPRFNEQTPVASITRGDAKEFVAWMHQHGNIRDKNRSEMSENTVRRRTGIAKQIFTFAIECKWIQENPFDGLVCTVMPNEDRMYFVTQAAISQVIEMAPDAHFRAVIALARFGGLRIPSELSKLKWADVDFAGGRMLIHAPKTEHHKGKATRFVPLFPELRPYLEDLRRINNEATPNALVIHDAAMGKNYNRRVGQIVVKSGLEVWPKLFQNLRASRETELLAHYPVKDVCGWIGNSQAVAMRHYAMMNDAMFVKAASEGAAFTGDSTVPKVGAEIGAFGAQDGAIRTIQESSEDTAESHESQENHRFPSENCDEAESQKWAIQDSNL